MHGPVRIPEVALVYNRLYNMIEIKLYRIRIGYHYSRQIKWKGFDYLNFFDILIIMALLLIAGIERNPGPSTNDSASDSTYSHVSFDDAVIKGKFSIVHYNVQSVSSKIDLIESELHNFDIVCLTETWLDGRTSDNDILLNGFNLYRRDRGGDSYGGVCVYVKQNIFSRRRYDLELPAVECVWLEVLTHHKKYLIGTFYRPPNSINAYFSAIEDSISLAFDTNIQDILITGDFNLDISKQASNKKISDICQHFNLKQLILEPTHYTETSSSVIDLFLISNKNHVLLSGVGEPFLDQNLRYHCPIYCVLHFNKYVSPTYTRQIWLYDRGDFQSLSRELEETDWNSLHNNDIDIYATNITDKILRSASKHIPNKSIHVRSSDPPWLTNSIIRLMRKRKRLYDKFKKSRNITDFENYKRVRNKVTCEIRKSKKENIQKLAEKLQRNDNCPKDWWKTLKTFIKPEQPSTLPPLSKDGIIYTSDEDKANALNQFFTEQTILDESNSSLPSDTPPSPHKLETIFITVQEVESTLKALKQGKAAGPDSINNRLLKELSQPLSVPLTDLFNYTLAIGKIPSMWKQANVTPVFKKDDPSEVSNYRPISLLSTIGKVLEKIIHKHVFNYFRDHNIITALQSGFVPGDSTVNQLVDIYNTFCKALDEGKEVRAIFCDISKAFDRVWHKGLLFKLHSVGISGPLLLWFTDYLQNRKQRVVLPGVNSTWASVKAGVPQGSILGPLLFLLYINDIVENINSSIRLFADDTSLYIIVDNPVDAANQLNQDLSTLHHWATKWLVTFNPLKSETITFTRKINKPQHPLLTMDQQHIKEVNNHKHLGIVFSNDCSWHEHLEYIKAKAWARINVMRKLKFQLDRRSLEIIYISFIRPLLEYADIVWDNCSQYEADELEKIQNEAARIVTGATKLVSVNSLLLETGWEKLSSRRKKHKLIMLYKMQNDISPEYLSSLVPPTVGNTTTYQLRNSMNLNTIHANSQLYYKSFLPSVLRDWNDLPLETRDSPSISALKHELNNSLTQPPKFYLEGIRLGQVYHTRLRTNCSSLQQHLFSKNIIDNPFCICGAVESTNHYLFECNRFNDLRQELLNKVNRFCPPTLNILLYGNNELTDTENKQIFLAVQDYILKSKRFQVT